jgi:hypothetical protein
MAATPKVLGIYDVVEVLGKEKTIKRLSSFS